MTDRNKTPIFIHILWLLMAFSSVAKERVLPEAYAGLSNDSYHLLTMSRSAKQGLVLSMQDHSWTLDWPESKANEKNISFKQNIDGGYISATQGNNSLFGEMHLHNKHYIITTNQSGIWAVELPASGLSYNDCGMDHAPNNNQPFKALDASPAAPTTQAAGTIIDVLVIHDQAIADRYPGDLLDTRVAQYINVSNQTYANSDLDLALRLVGLEQVNYTQNADNQGLRDLMQQVLSLGTGFFGLQPLPQLYASSGADLVIFIRPHDIETRGNCGIAYFPQPLGSGLDPTFGINVMSDGMSSWSLCTDQLMVHEIGHNLGAGHHNWDPTDFGFLPEARGFAKLGQFGTVMGSFGTGTVDRFLELNYFSNPNIDCGGGPCGTPGERDNVFVINSFKGFVADYQNAISSVPLPADLTEALIDQDGDGVLDRDDEYPFNPNETIDSDGDGVGDNLDAFPNDASEQADFDGDGTGDNADSDDDQDGRLDSSDAFPFNPNETSDSDFDGTGNNTDVFPFDGTESRDTDGDDIGDNADPDDDNDGVTDLAADKQDLLVINTGNNRILRFDAQTGLPKGIEVLPTDGVLTFQSDITFDAKFNRLFFTSASSIKSLDLMDPYAEPELLIAPFSNPEATSGFTLNTGFPLALEAYELSITSEEVTDLFWTKIGRANVPSEINAFAMLENNTTGYAFPFFDLLAEGENIIDIEEIDGQFYFQGQGNSVYKSTREVFESEVLGSGNYSWLDDPYALVATADDLLLHSDQGRDAIVITDAVTGTDGGVFADIAALGYSNPTGMDITADGRLLVAVADQNAILQFDLDSQTFLGELVKGAGMSRPHKMVLVPQLADRFHRDAEKVLRPNAGNWFNPATSGRGFNIGVFDNRLQVLWFTFDDEGLPIWYTSADFLVGHEFSTDLLKTTQVDDSTVTIETVGRITLNFDNERQASFEWEIGEDSGAENIEWLPFSGEPEIENYTGMWSRPDTPGWGMAVTTIGDKSIIIPFIYDSEGEPRWAISDVQTGVQPFDFNMSAVFSDTLCPGCTGEPVVTIEPTGAVVLRLGDAADWSSAMFWADPIPGSWLLDETEIVRISSEPVRPR